MGLVSFFFCLWCLCGGGGGGGVFGGEGGGGGGVVCILSTNPSTCSLNQSCHSVY